jgi:hypothetical protein
MFIRLGWGNLKLIFLTFLSLKNLWWDVKSISGYFFFLGLSEAPRPWRLKILIWRPKFGPYIDMVLYMVANCSLVTNFVIWRSTLNVTGWNWSKFGEIWKLQAQKPNSYRFEKTNTHVSNKFDTQTWSNDTFSFEIYMHACRFKLKISKTR